jgi:zinc/manganese transport system permease protein
VLAIAARPLLFSTIDRDLAHASGIPVGVLDAAFLLLLAIAVAATSQITGVLLVFAVLVAPPATAQLVTTRPLASLMLSVAFALVVVWLGLGVAYFSIYPVGFYTTTFAFGLYLAVRTTRWALRGAR